MNNAISDFQLGYNARLNSPAILITANEAIQRGWKTADEYLSKQEGERSESPHLDKLKALLYGDPDNAVKDFKVSWGPNAHLVSVEERAKIIFDSMLNAKIVVNVDEHGSGDGEAKVDQG